MGQFEENSMSLQVRGFEVGDPCVMEMRVCAESSQIDDKLHFNVDASGQVLRH
jgi:hypothetical protein